MKSGSLAEFRFHPDSAAALLDDALADSQTDARAREIAAVQPFEDAEDLLMIARIDPDAVVSNGELHRIAGVAGRNMDLGRLGPRNMIEFMINCRKTWVNWAKSNRTVGSGSLVTWAPLSAYRRVDHQDGALQGAFGPTRFQRLVRRSGTDGNT